MTVHLWSIFKSNTNKHDLFNYFTDICLQKRNELLMDMSREMISSAIVEGNVTIKSKRQLSQIIDTTLLKCYLQVHIFVHTCTFSETFNEVFKFVLITYTAQQC